jgi:hypothetical protein
LWGKAPQQHKILIRDEEPANLQRTSEEGGREEDTKPAVRWRRSLPKKSTQTKRKTKQGSEELEGLKLKNRKRALSYIA